MTVPEGSIGRVLVDFTELAKRVRELGAQITKDYAGRSPLLVSVLKGAFVLMSDLAREICDAATGGEFVKPSKSTTTVYRDLLEAMWLLDPLSAWWPLSNPLSRLKRCAKHHLPTPH